METAMTVAITHQDLSAANLRQAAARMGEAKVARRMLAIALVIGQNERNALLVRISVHRNEYRTKY